VALIVAVAVACGVRLLMLRLCGLRLRAWRLMDFLMRLCLLPRRLLRLLLRRRMKFLTRRLLDLLLRRLLDLLWMILGTCGLSRSRGLSRAEVPTGLRDIRGLRLVR
jgi:hypothetical protein